MSRTIISEDGKFEWDSVKSLTNKMKHGFTFDEITCMFTDPYIITRYDEEHSSQEEERFISIGCAEGTLIIISICTIRKSRIRIITARLATAAEKEVYFENIKKIVAGQN